LKKGASILVLFFFALWILMGCGNNEAFQPVDALTAEVVGTLLDDESSAVQPEEPDPVEVSGQDYQDDKEIHALLEKGAGILNISCTARFNNSETEYIYEFYRRGNLSKKVIRDGDFQSISVSDGQSTIHYSLPEKTGFTLLEAGDYMGLIPSMEVLLDEEIFTFRTVGEEQFSGYICQVVETEDENGALKMWISKSLGLPIKYIGTDDNGWFSLELTEIQLGEPSESLFAIPSDIVMSY
jgi:outer membrane lipoprotein-sorting protein